MEKMMSMSVSRRYLMVNSILILSVIVFLFGNALASETAEQVFKKGIEYANKGNYDQAISDLSKAITLNPGDANVYLSRGNVYQNNGNYDQAISDLSKAITLNPNYASAYLSRGNAYQNKGNYDQAISDFSKAITLNPNYANAYLSRGNAYYQKKDYDKAWADMHKIEELGGKPNPGLLEKLEKASGKRKIDVYLAPK